MADCASSLSRGYASGSIRQSVPLSCLCPSSSALRRPADTPAASSGNRSSAPQAALVGVVLAGKISLDGPETGASEDRESERRRRRPIVRPGQIALRDEPVLRMWPLDAEGR